MYSKQAKRSRRGSQQGVAQGWMSSQGNLQQRKDKSTQALQANAFQRIIGGLKNASSSLGAIVGGDR